jgi:hypothetical protein
MLNGKTKVNGNECVKDNDCIKVQTGCCSCNMGGDEKCVSISKSKEYSKLLENCSKEKIICPAFYNCNIQSCRCIKNKCEIVKK